jgi:hypothetical protein
MRPSGKEKGSGTSEGIGDADAASGAHPPFRTTQRSGSESGLLRPARATADGNSTLIFVVSSAARADPTRSRLSGDRRVEQSLYRRAVGYSYDTVKIMGYQGEYTHVPYVAHVPPDTTACIFWLKNRQRDLWRDRVDATAKVVRDVVTMTDDELIDIIRRESNGRAN